MKMEDVVERFHRDTDQHVLTVVRDDGLYRHLRFAKPGTGAMSVQIVTWPGYLCYTGDMGTYVFRRLQDMFEFFSRSGKEHPFRMDLGYWAQKAEAVDKNDGLDEFVPELFRQAVTDDFETYTEGWPPDRKAALWQAIEEACLPGAGEEGRDVAFTRVRDFEWRYELDGKEREFQFFDFWEHECRDFSYRFKWACCAIVAVITAYEQLEAVAGDPNAPSPLLDGVTHR